MSSYLVWRALAPERRWRDRRLGVILVLKLLPHRLCRCAAMPARRPRVVLSSYNTYRLK